MVYSGRFSDSVWPAFRPHWSQTLIVGGLAVFAAGSVIAALSDPSGELFWAGRYKALEQLPPRYGAAFRSHARTKPHQSDGVIGVSFGITFAIAMVLGPIITTNLGCTRCSG